jgi:uncharacterized membrane protein
MLGWQIIRFTASGGQAMLQTITTMTLSFIVFTFGSLLVAIQVAGGQLTPRVIATTLLRDNVVRYTVGLFVFSLLFAISVQNRIEGTGDQLVLVVAGVLGLLSTAAFLYLIDYAARLLRPISILSRVGENGLTVIASVYPTPIQGPSLPHIKTPEVPSRIVRHAGRSEVILSVNIDTLLAESQKANVVVELIPVDNVIDESGKLWVVFRTPNWEDFVNLACTELRRYGADSIQVVRRLRAMIEKLISTLPEDRHAALQAQLALLDQTINAIYSLPEELALARATDSQGLGGHRSEKQPAEHKTANRSLLEQLLTKVPEGL